MHNTPTRDELGLSSVAEKLQTLNSTIEAGLKKTENIKNHKEEKQNGSSHHISSGSSSTGSGKSISTLEILLLGQQHNKGRRQQ